MRNLFTMSHREIPYFCLINAISCVERNKQNWIYVLNGEALPVVILTCWSTSTHGVLWKSKDAGVIHAFPQYIVRDMNLWRNPYLIVVMSNGQCTRGGG